jgi:hypothetical protein
MGDNIPGKRREILSYLGGVSDYLKKCRESAERHYDGFILQ